ncbi:hypothetical protein O181_044767 [Austropuccinia psidii MF-1]|uniref:DDE Tnp4 domain-containing protein n=1 Tax=Austropuccinia psidii MF-1 TaxID=1389203 RepID=A0A9Q3DSH0_9BASI|nr:hypothetical protein [Austropuccinia psidii MF-1]
MLKGLWASLKQLRLKLNGPKDIKSYVQWISACVILYNMLSSIKDSWEELSDEDQVRCPAQGFHDFPSQLAQDLQEFVRDACVSHNYLVGQLPIR